MRNEEDPNGNTNQRNIDFIEQFVDGSLDDMAMHVHLIKTERKLVLNTALRSLQLSCCFLGQILTLPERKDWRMLDSIGHDAQSNIRTFSACLRCCADAELRRDVEADQS